MTLYVLDTDHVSFSQRKYPIVLQHLAKVEYRALAVTIITAEEQLKGRFKLIQQASNGSRLVQAYTNLQATIGYFNSIQVLPFDQVACGHYETLRQQKVRIGTRDLRIAAIVLAVNGVLVTRNWKDFAQVPNLELVDWTIP
jgi:tRNA(fMet)-specific endonuclease VapC